MPGEDKIFDWRGSFSRLLFNPIHEIDSKYRLHSRKHTEVMVIFHHRERWVINHEMQIRRILRIKDDIADIIDIPFFDSFRGAPGEASSDFIKRAYGPETLPILSKAAYFQSQATQCIVITSGTVMVLTVFQGLPAQTQIIPPIHHVIPNEAVEVHPASFPDGIA